MTQFDLVAMGGTFDIIHAGHTALLEKAFSIANKVIIGLTSDDMVARKGKKIVNNYSKRKSNLIHAIKTNFPNSSYEISMLDNDFGPAVLEENVQALVVSDETKNQGAILNQMRKERKLSPVAVIIVPMILAKDGSRISSTRIRNEEIDSRGNLLSN